VPREFFEGEGGVEKKVVGRRHRLKISVGGLSRRDRESAAPPALRERLMSYPEIQGKTPAVDGVCYRVLLRVRGA
jgi:hypothetical protein